MQAGHKPFVVYRRGPLSFTIVPRGLNGWLQFGAWLALLVPLALWLDTHIETRGGQADFADGVLLFIMATLVWLVCGVWWMLARAAVIDVSELMRDRQRERRKRERQG